MKKLLTTLALILTFSFTSFAQGVPAFVKNFTFTATGDGDIIDVPNTGWNYIKLSWDLASSRGNPGSAVSACAFTLMGSQDRVTFGTTHDTVSNCTTDGQNQPRAITGGTSFLKLNVGTFTRTYGNPILNVTLMAWYDVIGANTSEPAYGPASTLWITATSTANNPVTATLPSVTNQTHYLTYVRIMRTCTTAISGTATLNLTSTNLPGSLNLTFGNACVVGATSETVLTFPSGLKASATGASTLVCPALGAAGICEINVGYFTAPF